MLAIFDGWRACTCGELTYVRVLKNASSFFYNNLVGQYKWQEIDAKAIDWSHSRVFGHIQDPVERRHKGILEHLLVNDCLDLLEHDAQFRRMIKHVPTFDEHNASLYEMFGQTMWAIDWIPLSKDHKETVRQTEKLLATTGNRRVGHLGLWDWSEARPAAAHMIKAADSLRDLWSDGMPPPFSRRFIEKDQTLFKAVTDSFNALGFTWQQTSWLRDRG